jgi:hypothetical protein
MPGAELPQQLVLAAWKRPHAIAGIHPVRADQLDVAQGAVADPLDQGLARGRMAGHQPGGDLQVLLLRRFARADNPLDAARIGREILLHEHVDALFDRIFQVRAAERGVRGQHRDVARAEAIDRMPIGVEAQESSLLRHVDVVAEQFAQSAVA